MQLRRPTWITDARFSCFVPNWLLVADNLGTLTILDVDAEEEVLQLDFEDAGHMYAPRRIAFALAPDGDRLAIARTEQNVIRFYRIAEQRWEDLELTTTKAVHDLGFTGDGRLIAGTYYGGLKVFNDLVPGEEPESLGSKTAKIEDMRVSAGGSICLRYGFRKWRSLHVDRLLAPQAHRQMDLGDCGDTLVAVCDESTFRVRRAGKHKRTYTVGGCRGVAVAGSEIFVAWDNGVRVYDAEGQLLYEHAADLSDITQIAVSSDGTRVAAWTRFEALRTGNENLSVFDLRDRHAEPEEQSETDYRWSSEVDVAGHRIVLSKGKMEIFELGKGGEPRVIRHDGIDDRATLHVAPSDRVVLRTRQSIELRDVPSMELVQRCHRPTLGMRLSRRGTFWAEWHGGGIRFYDPRDLRRVIGEIPMDTSEMVDFDVLPDDRILFATLQSELYLVDLPMVTAAPRPRRLVRLDCDLVRLWVGEQHGKSACQIGLMRTDGTIARLSLRLPAAKSSRDAVTTATRTELDAGLSPEVTRQIRRLGGSLEEPYYQFELEYPDGVFPLPRAVRQLLGTEWPTEVYYTGAAPDSWNGVFGSGQEPSAITFAPIGLDPLADVVKRRVLERQHLVAIGQAGEQFIAVDIDSGSADPVVFLIDAFDRARAVRLSGFLGRLRQVRESSLELKVRSRRTG